ncbi:TPA: hypothetical protein HA244_05100, partial [Candidatus Micrarchaeota archaeon]|nr:hypothetical protein [Candidatus Micrarchaeota archaeon]
GFPSGGDTLVGTGTQDRGKAGVYVFKGLYPRTVGVFHVEADAGPDFENAISQDVQSVSTSFLDIDPSDFVFNTAGACANGVTVRLLKNIPVGVNVSYQVSGAQSQEQCVEVQQPTTSPFVFDRTRTSKDIVIKPIQNANCALVFAGVLAGSGSVSQAQANLFVNCENLRATPTPDPNATCSDGTSVGACSAVNVGARCNSNLQLVGDIACINGPGGNETCTDGTAMGACSSANAGKRCSSTFTLIDDSTCSATGSQCSPNTCSACAENQCVNLQNAGFCEPVYASGASYNNSISATDIGGRRFVPALAFVRPGDVITWRNNGIEDHQIVFENSSVSPSQSQVLHPGDSFSMTLAQAGAYAYRDGLHPEMRGQVSIVPQNAGQQFLTCISSPTSRPLNCSRLSNDIFKAGMAAGDSIKAPDGSRTVKVTSIDEGTKTASFDILGRDGKKIDSAALKKCDTYAKDGVQFRITDFHSIDVSASFVPSAADFIQDACSPMKFDIGKLFASRLGYLAAQQVFNPSQTQAAIASTASNQLVHYPNAPYFAIMENGPGCTGSGTSLSCTKKITALLPVNGMALSVQNAFGFDTRLNVQTTGSGASCFEVKRITGSALSKIGLFVQETLSGLLPIPGNQYGTVAILFKGDNPDCVDYTFTSDHKVHIKPKAGKDKLDLLLTNPTLQKGLEVPLFKITLRIVPGADSSFALASAPRFTYDKSFPTRIESALEPFVVANNLLTPAYVGSQVIAPKGEVQGLGLKLDDDNGYQVAFPPTAASSDTFAPQQERVPDDSGGDLNEPFDIIGNTGGDEAGESIYNSCSGKDFCTAQDQDALTESIKTGVMQEYKPVLETMDSVSFTSPFNAGQGVVQQAGRAAAGDYASSLTNYYLCKQFGQDPLLQLAQQCYSNMGNPQQPSSFLGSLTQGAQYAGCNSELFDMAFGASRGVAGVGGNIMQGAVGQALNNVPPNMPVGEGIVFGFRKLNTYVTVPVKIAGQEGGFKAIVLNLDLRNAAAAFSSGDFFHSGVDGQEIFTLYGTFGFHGLSFFKPGSRKGSTDPGSDKPLQPYDDGYPFLKKASAAAAILTPTTGGQATLDVAKVGTPNLFTFNKYGFNGKVSLDATSLSSISADPTASQYATQIKTELAAFFVDQKSTFDQSYGVTIVAGDKESIEISSASLLSAAQIVKEYNFADATGFVTPDTQAPSFTTGASGDASIGGGSKNIFNLKITFDKNQLSADSATTASPYVQALQKAKAELYAQVFIRVIQNVMPYLNDEGQSGPSGGVGPFACIEWAESSASKIVLAKSSKVNDVNNEGVETSFTLDAPFACLQGDDFSSILGSSSYLDAVRAIR